MYADKVSCRRDRGRKKTVWGGSKKAAKMDKKAEKSSLWKKIKASCSSESFPSFPIITVV